MYNNKTAPNKPATDFLQRLFPGRLLLLLSAIVITTTAISTSAIAASNANQLNNVSISTLPGDSVQIRLKFSDIPHIPGSFTINSPARIVLDFPNTGSDLGWKNKNIGIGLAKSVTAVEAGDRTRVILNLVQLIPFDSVVEHKDVVITLASGRTLRAPAASTKTTGNKAAAATGLHHIDGIDFRRGKDGEGNIILSLSDENTPVSTGESGQQIIVEFGDTSLPQSLEQRMDVIDFATPVQYIDISQSDDHVRLAITPTGDYEYLAYQSGDEYTIEVKEVTKEELASAKKDAFGYTGERLSLNFQDIEVRAVLQLIADFTGLNMVTSDSVQGNLTLRLKNVPWDQALDIVLKTKGLAMRKAGNVILVAPAEEIAAQEKLELEASKQIEELAPLKTELVQVNYAKASEIAALLQAKGGLMSVRGDVSVDTRTNTVLITDSVDRLESVRKLITDLDIPVRQVMIETRIVIANDDFAKDLGARFGISGVKRDGNGLLVGSGSLAATDVVTDDGLGGVIGSLPATNANRLNVNLPVSASDAGSFALSILGSNVLLDLELTALQTEGRGEVISNPRVITSNQQTATIQQGTEIPYQEASSSGATTVSFKKAVLSMEVTPQITPDDRIILDLKVNKDSVGELFTSANIPSIDTREVQTQVLMNNGETVVLGGVYEQTTINTKSRVPFFGDLPVVGALFRSTSQQNDKDELLIFVTPKILKESFSAN